MGVGDPPGNSPSRNGGSESVSVYTIDPTSGALTPVGTATTGKYPVGVAIDPSGQYAYVTNDIDGTISVYLIDPMSGALTPMWTVYATGTNPVGVAVDPSGRFVYVTNYESNNVSVYAIGPTNTAY